MFLVQFIKDAARPDWTKTVLALVVSAGVGFSQAWVAGAFSDVEPTAEVGADVENCRFVLGDGRRCGGVGH